MTRRSQRPYPPELRERAAVRMVAEVGALTCLIGVAVTMCAPRSDAKRARRMTRVPVRITSERSPISSSAPDTRGAIDTRSVAVVQLVIPEVVARMADVIGLLLMAGYLGIAVLAARCVLRPVWRQTRSRVQIARVAARRQT